MSDARAEVLGRIGSALGASRGPTPPADPVAVAAGVERRYRRPSQPAGVAGPRPGLVERFVERVGEYEATVTVVSPEDVATAVASCIGGGRALAAPGLAVDWLSRAPGVEWDDPPHGARELAAFDTAVTGCALAIAETGTIVLSHGPGQGRRALTLVPDHHVCVVVEEQVVLGVVDAVAALSPTGVLTFVSGPSATSDIELDRVVGVHGPRHLDVVVVRRGG